MSEAESEQSVEPDALAGPSAAQASGSKIPSGILPLDERVGGLERRGSYLIVGAPGPANMVAALQFLHAGVARGEAGLLVTNADAASILDVAGAWGFELEEAWGRGQLKIVGFRHDFELRAIRSIEPEEVLEELDELAGRDLSRIAVDPGSMFLSGGAKSLLGAAFLRWARSHPATVCATFSVDGSPSTLPSSADWMINSTSARIVIEPRSGGLLQVSVAKAVPDPEDRDQTVSIQLKPGAGLIAPESFPSERGADRAGIDPDRLLLVSLGGQHESDLETWARRAFEADVVSEPFDAVARVQGESSYGSVVIHAPRTRVREAVQACRALRPLTRAAIVFASDDAVRSTDRIHVLEAGADDCLSGGVDFRELGLRIKQAVAAGAKQVEAGVATDSEGEWFVPEADGALVSREVFAREIRRRAEDPTSAFFCVLDLHADGMSIPDLEGALAAELRHEEGDLVSTDGGGCMVLLQGAREGHSEPFLARLRSRIGGKRGKGPTLQVEVLSHPAEANRIEELLGDGGGTTA